jgi:[ribosomal protein S5]-alanine N-acetyltransferase
MIFWDLKGTRIGGMGHGLRRFFKNPCPIPPIRVPFKSQNPCPIPPIRVPFVKNQMQIQFTPFPDLYTERLQLRQLALSDEHEIYVQRSDPRIIQYLDRPKASDLDAARLFIQNINAGVAENRAVYWAITLKNTPALIGTICLWNISPEKSKAELGYSLHPDFQGKGYMQEALEKVVDYAFVVMQADVIEAFSHPENAPSIRLLQKNNFIYREKQTDGFLFFTRST